MAPNIEKTTLPLKTIHLKLSILPNHTLSDDLADALVSAAEVLGVPSKARRHFVAVTLVHALKDIAQEGLVVGFQGHIFIGLDHPNGSGSELAYRQESLSAHVHIAPQIHALIGRIIPENAEQSPHTHWTGACLPSGLFFLDL